MEIVKPVNNPCQELTENKFIFYEQAFLAKRIIFPLTLR